MRFGFLSCACCLQCYAFTRYEKSAIRDSLPGFRQLDHCIIVFPVSDEEENQKRIHYKIWSPRLFYYNLSEPEKDTLQDLVSTVTTDVEKGVPELEKYSF